MLGGTAVFIISLVDVTLAKTVVPTTLAGIVVPATFVCGYKVKKIRKENYIRAIWLLSQNAWTRGILL